MGARLDTPILPSLTLNEITLVAPRAVEVFARYRLDACCGGAKTLATVCERHGLSLENLLIELRAVAE